MTRAVLIAVATLGARAALADGGAPVASVAGPSGVRTLLMRPAEARVGPVEFTLLGARTDGAALSLLAPGESSPTTVEWSDGPGGTVQAVVELDRVGAWRVSVGAPGGAPTLEATVEVADPRPPWTERWPWLVAWIPLAALVACRNAAVIYTARRTRA